jgi:hypothetical protein
MAWSQFPPDDTQNIQRYPWAIQPLESIRQINWFLTGSKSPPAPTPSPTPPPHPPPQFEPPDTLRKRFPKFSDPKFWGLVTTFVENEVYVADGVTVWDAIDPNPWQWGEASFEWPQSPWSVLVASDVDANINSDHNFRFDVQKIDVSLGSGLPTGNLILRGTRDALTSKYLDAYSTLNGKDLYVIPRYGLGWFERWPAIPNPTQRQWAGVTDWRVGRRPTKTRLYFANELPAGFLEPKLVKYFPHGDVDTGLRALSMVSGQFNATDPDNPSTATHELMVWGNEVVVSDDDTEIPPPDAPAITNVGTAGTTKYVYRVTALYGGSEETDVSDPGQTTTGNRTLDATNYNTVTWTAVTGATGYRIYGRLTGFEYEVGQVGAGVTTYDDKGTNLEGTAPRKGTAILMHRIPIKSNGADYFDFWSDPDVDDHIIEETAGTSSTYEANPDADWFPNYGDPTLGRWYEFAVVHKASKHWLDKPMWEPFSFYQSTGWSDKDPSRAWARVFGHQPDDTIRSVKLPGGDVYYEEGNDPLLCDGTETAHPGFDNDLWSSSDNVCGPPNRPYSREHWWSPRAWQLELQRLALFMVEDRDYTGEDAIPNFCLAEYFHAAGINAHVSTISAIGSTLTISAISPANFGFTGVGGDDPEYPLLVYYGIRDFPAGEFNWFGSALLTNATTLAIDLSGESTDTKTRLTGKQIVLSPGWTQTNPLNADRLAEQWMWVPDKDEFGVVVPSPTILDFEESGLQGRGTWVQKLPDVGYDVLANKGDGSQKLFAANDICRYHGDNWHRAISAPGSAAFPSTTGHMDEILPWWDSFYVGKLKKTNQIGKVDSLRSGIAVEVGPRRLHIEDSTWFKFWHSEGVIHTETGTADSGSSNVLIKDGSRIAGDESGAFFDSTAFPPGFSAYETFTIQVQHTDLTWHRRLIVSTTINDTTGLEINCLRMIRFRSIRSGRPWKIEHAREHMRWRNRPVKMVWPADEDGLVHIEWNRLFSNDDKVLHLKTDPTQPLVVGVKFEIMNVIPGPVGRFVTTEPTGDDRPNYLPVKSLQSGSDNLFFVPIIGGSDTARLGVLDPADFVSDPLSNWPQIVRRFGLMTKGQFLGKRFWGELRKGADALTAFKTTTGSYSNWKDPSTPENYLMTVYSGDGTFLTRSHVDMGASPPDFDCFDCADDDSTLREFLMYLPDNFYTTPPAQSTGGAYNGSITAPHASSLSRGQEENTQEGADIQVGWWKPQVASTWLDHTVDVYAKADFNDGIDVDTGWPTPPSSDPTRVTTMFNAGGSGLTRGTFTKVGTLSSATNADPINGKVKVGGNLMLPPWGRLLDVRHNTSSTAYVGPGGSGAISYTGTDEVTSGWGVTATVNVYRCTSFDYHA